MKIIVSWAADHLKMKISLATQANDVDGLRKIGQLVENASNIWSSWCTNNGGGIIVRSGDQGQAQVPAEYVSDIPRLKEQYAQAIDSSVSVGVGITAQESSTALKAAQIRGGDRVVMYTDEVKAEVAEHAEGKDKDPLANVDPMAKAAPGPTFPKLGFPDNRRETKILSTPTEVKSGVLAGQRTAEMHHQDVTGKKLGPKTKEMGAQQAHDTAEKILAGKSGHKGGQSTSQGSSVGYAVGEKFLPKRLQGDGGASVMGTLHHENFHGMLGRVENEHGPEARDALVENLFNAIPKQYQPHVERLFNSATGGVYANRPGAKVTEEKLARVLNYMNSSVDRRAFHNSLDQLEDPDYSETGFDNNIKRAYKAMNAAAETAGPEWLQRGHIPAAIQKAEAMNEGEHAGFSGASQASGPSIQAPEQGAPEQDPTTAAHQAAESAPSPEMTHSADDMEQQFHDLAGQHEQEQQAQAPGPDDEVKAQIVKILQVLKGQAPVMEQIKQSAPDTYQAVLAMTQAVIAMAKKMNGDHPQTSAKEIKDRAQSDAQVEVPAQEEEKEEGEETKKSESKVELDPSEPVPTGKKLEKQDIKPKKMIPEGMSLVDFAKQVAQKSAARKARIADLVATTHGSAWKTPTGSVVVSPDQHDLSRWRATPIKEGGVPEQHLVAATHEGALEAAHGLGADLHGQPLKFRPAKPAPAELDKASLSPTAGNKAPPQHHHLALPVGTQIDTNPSGTRRAGYVKILHSDAETSAPDKEGWVSVRAGRVLSQDGHAISSKNAGGK